MRWLIVNADEFGMGPGINRGILDAYRDGIVTSASLLVDGPWSLEAARMCREARQLSVGLHARLNGLASTPGHGRAARCRAELTRQFTRFKELMGHPPSHLDSHLDTHRDPAVTGVFLELADWWGVPLRGHSPIHHLPKFHGRWGGGSEPERISVSGLLRMLETDVNDGVTELRCHPGHHDPHSTVDYLDEREIELETLCDARVRRAVWSQGIRLASYHDFARAGTLREVARQA